MATRAIDLNVYAHPYCEDYFRWMDQQEAERLIHHEVDDEFIDSTDDFFNRTVNGPLSDEELPPALSLDEFEDIFNNSDVVY